MVFSVFSLFFHPSQRQHAGAAALAPCASAARAGASFMIVRYWHPFTTGQAQSAGLHPVPFTPHFRILGD